MSNMDPLGVDGFPPSLRATLVVTSIHGDLLEHTRRGEVTWDAQTL